jgi:probable HAF family extracellular repeat protein
MVIWKDTGRTITDVCGTPSGINESGEIVGSAAPASGKYDFEHAFAWHNGEHQFLGATDRRSAANGVNGDGIVVGNISRGGRTLAVQWNATKMTLLETRPGAESDALAVSDRGVVVGWHADPHSARIACEWVHGKIKELPDLGGPVNTASAVDRSGDVLGIVDVPDGADGTCPPPHIVIWRNGKLEDLTKLVPELSRLVEPEAGGIAASGDVLVQGVSGGRRTAFLVHLAADRASALWRR